MKARGEREVQDRSSQVRTRVQGDRGRGKARYDDDGPGEGTDDPPRTVGRPLDRPAPVRTGFVENARASLVGIRATSPGAPSTRAAARGIRRALAPANERRLPKILPAETKASDTGGGVYLRQHLAGSGGKSRKGSQGAAPIPFPPPTPEGKCARVSRPPPCTPWLRCKGVEWGASRRGHFARGAPRSRGRLARAIRDSPRTAPAADKSLASHS